MRRMLEFACNATLHALMTTCAASLLVAACAGSRPSGNAPGSAIPPGSESAPSAAPIPLPATAPLAAEPRSDVPPLASAPPSTAARPASAFAFANHIPQGTLYVCTSGSDAAQTPIEYEPKVRDLCAKHPEMGVCQYGRDACRASGGRVYDAGGVEITKAIEAEYDRKVMRFRLRS